MTFIFGHRGLPKIYRENSIGALNKAFDYKPLYVIHLAALFANQNSVDNPINDLKWKQDYKSIKLIIYEHMALIYNKIRGWI